VTQNGNHKSGTIFEVWNLMSLSRGKKASVNDAEFSLGDAKNFEQIDIEVEPKSDLCK